MIVQVVKTVELNLLKPTAHKESVLLELVAAYLSAANIILNCLKSQKFSSKFNLQSSVYSTIRSLGLHAQHAVDVVKDVWIQRDKVKAMDCFKHLPIRFNIPRSGAYRFTKRNNPVFSIATLNGRIGLPIKQDGAYKRFLEFLNQGYKFTEFTLLKKNKHWVIHVVLKKEFESHPHRNILGIDIGTRFLAAISVVSNSKILKQLYFGKDVSAKKRDIGIRRSKLQSLGARRALDRLRAYETDFTKTRCYQIAHEIVKLALEYDCDIAIEDLNGLNKSRLNRKSNRKVKRMPYAMFRAALESVAAQNGVNVIAVDPKYTSKTCYKCGSRGSRTSQAIFKCNCGHTTNADRNASVNIALRAVDHAPTVLQIPQGRVVVTQPDCVRDNGVEPSHGFNLH